MGNIVYCGEIGESRPIVVKFKPYGRQRKANRTLKYLENIFLTSILVLLLVSLVFLFEKNLRISRVYN